jgi:hypothetical protein
MNALARPVRMPTGKLKPLRRTLGSQSASTQALLLSASYSERRFFFQSARGFALYSRIAITRCLSATFGKGKNRTDVEAREKLFSCWHCLSLCWIASCAESERREACQGWGFGVMSDLCRVPRSKAGILSLQGCCAPRTSRIGKSASSVGSKECSEAASDHAQSGEGESGARGQASCGRQ